MGHLVEHFGRYRLRCGKASDFGYRHILQRHGRLTHQTYRCIERVLATGAAKRLGKQIRYQLDLARGDWARVIVEGRDVVTVYTKGFGDS